MSDGVQRGKSTVSRSVRDCLPICLPSTTRHSTFQRTPADDVPAYLAPRPPGGRQWHGKGGQRHTVALLSAEAGRHPHDRRLSDLIGKLSTRSDKLVSGGPPPTARSTAPASSSSRRCIRIGRLDQRLCR